MGLRSEVIRSWKALDALEGDWDRLWRAGFRTRRLCLAYRWVRTIMAWFDGSRGTTTRPWCVVLRDGTDAVRGIAPLVEEEGSNGRRVRSLPDWVERNHAFLCDGPVAPLARAVRWHLDHDGKDALRLRGVLRGEAQALLEAWDAPWRATALRMSLREGKDGAVGTCFWDRRSIVLAGSWEAWLERRTVGFRRSLRRSWRRAAKVGEARYWRRCGGRQLAGEPLPTSELLRLFRAVEERAWQHEDRFGPDGEGRVIVDTLEPLGMLDASLLFLDGQPVTYEMGHVAGGGATSKYAGYDPAVRECSPGTLALSELVRTSFEAGGLDEINLRGSEHEYKRVVTELVESAFELELLARSPRGLVTAVSRRWDSGRRLVGAAALREVATPDALSPPDESGCGESSEETGPLPAG